ncbi:hypothetical protein [Phenylobacterium sp. LH3H17]|uniref:hypothetical protein n=1 Tax=Phenylobacterium sp. LH3H17 TaxID=2903901 RepID=UPI003530F6D2
MKNKTLTLFAAAAASVLALSAGTASAQAWSSINERQATLDARIDAGVRSGDLTRSEAVELRSAFNDVARLEARYRVDGLSAWEREDLDRRFDALSNRIRYDRNDSQDRRDNGNGRWDNDNNGRWDNDDNGRWDNNNWRDGQGRWMNINQRQAQLDRRIDQGVRSGKITTREAYRLRADFQVIARLEARYRVNGLSAWERTDLDRRFNTLAARIRWERRDDERYRDGYGQRR